MDSAPEIATLLDTWLTHLGAGCGDFLATAAVSPTPTFREIGSPLDTESSTVTAAALAALAAEALARDRTLWIITADDSWLPDISNALDLQLRPLCLVLPGADYAGRIALRATLSLLKSRLMRDTTDSEGPAWAALRQRLRRDDVLWRACLAWSTRGLDREAPPAEIGSLFPVRIGPYALASRLAVPADWTVLVQAQQLPASLRTPWEGSQRTLMLAAGSISGVTSLTCIDESMRLRAEIEVLGQELAEMELELATAEGEMAAFGERYHGQIAWRMAELDRLQAELARLRAQQSPDDPVLDANARAAESRARQSRSDQDAYQSKKHEQELRFRPGQDLKKRFRQLAQKIHPDRAANEAERAWRTQLMAEANRAYRAGDATALDEVLTLWLEGRHTTPDTRSAAVSPAPTSGTSAGASAGISAAIAALAQQAARIRRRMEAITTALDRLYGSRLYELFAAARLAERQGRDLLQEMADRIDTQIADIRSALDALDLPLELPRAA